MTVSYKVKINQYILGSLLPKNRSFELQVKQPKNFQPKNLGCLYPFEFTVYTDLIFSLFDVASSQDVPFHQPQYVQCMYYGPTFVLLCVPVLFADNAKCQFAMARYGFHLAVSCFSCTFSIVTGFIAEKFLVLLFTCNTV